MQKPAQRFILILAMIALSGCQYFKFPGVYKINIQQGNIVTQEMVDQLKPGMTKRQVRFVMGNPLIQDTFNSDRWDYLYTLRPAKGESTKERISIYFENDTLSSISGDFLPSSAQTSP